MNTQWPVAALIALLGLVIGSFLNVVIYRVPRGQSILFPASHCTACGAELKARHNVPVLSWLVLHGRCAFCKTAISARYPAVEALTAGLFALLTAHFGLSAELPAYLFLAAAGVTLAMIDLDLRRLPNQIVLPAYVIAVLMLMPAGAATGDWRSAARALAGMAALAAIYAVLALGYPRGLDAGAVKVAGLAGLYLGFLSWETVLVGALGGLVIAAACGGVLTVTRGAQDGAGLAFAPFLLAATVLALFVTVPLTSWYGSLLTHT